MLEDGGTLAVFLACHALRKGYKATIFTYNLNVFDPTWFARRRPNLADRLARQSQLKADPKLNRATEGYLEFLRLGGRIRLEDLTSRLIRRHLLRGRPLLTGLSATFLYREAREIGADGAEDDLRGLPVGHFVVLCGYDRRKRQVLVADPLHPEPVSQDGIYLVEMDRVLNSVLLGVLTYDANLLVLDPPERTDTRG